MKKFFLFLSFTCLITGLTSFGQEPDFVIDKNADYTAQAENGTLVIARDVYSMKTALKRSIQLINPKTQQVIGEAFITLQGTDPGQNIYDALKETPEKFSGVLVIEADGKVLYRKEILNGISDAGGVVGERMAGNLAGGPGPVYNPNLMCSLGNIHNCVSYRIEEMSWWRFALCLVRAPACYAGQWAFCTYDVCVNHMQYTNPN